MASAAYGLRLPASASCLGRHLRLAGRCPNNSSLFPPLAAVVVVASHFQRKNDLDFRDTGASADAPVSLFSREGTQRGTVFAGCPLPEPSQALPRQLSRRESQAVKFSTKVLRTMRKCPLPHKTAR